MPHRLYIPMVCPKKADSRQGGYLIIPIALFPFYFVRNVLLVGYLCSQSKNLKDGK